jgi:hypothetical protein
MVERDITNKIMTQCEKRVCEVTKLADRFTKGIPDIVITGNGHNWWVEVKVIDAQPPVMLQAMHDRVLEDFVQFMKMRRLERLGEPGYAFYIFYNKATRLVYAVSPSELGDPANFPETVDSYKDIAALFLNEFTELPHAGTK